MSTSKTILENLIYNESYSRKVIAYIKDEYFSNKTERTLFQLIKTHIDKYNTIPVKRSLAVDLTNLTNLSDEEFDDCKNYIISLEDDNELDFDWLVDNTEEFCKERALNNALMESVSIVDGSSKKTKGMIPQILTEALSVTFNSKIGHDYFEDASQRYDYYHLPQFKIPCDIDYINKITKGGFSRKTFNLFMAPPNVGKTLVLCHLASSYLAQGYNVLYLTMEISEEAISQRIDQNLLNITDDELLKLPKDKYDHLLKQVKNKTKGKLITKEYPTATPTVHHFRALVNELKLKKNFFPDVIIIDYLNICASTRVKPDSLYQYVKSIGEELRGLMVELNVIGISATQANRGTVGASDMDMGDVADSFGTSMTVDFMLGLVSNEDLAKLNQYLCVQSKNRYMSKDIFKRFVIGVDTPRQKLYNVEDNAQENIVGNVTLLPVKENKIKPLFESFVE